MMLIIQIYTISTQTIEWSFNRTVDNWRLQIGNHDMCTGYAKTIKLYAEFWGYHNLVAERLQRFSQQFFITIRPVRCTIHFGRVKKYIPYLRHRSIVPLFYTYRQAHRRHDSYPCSPDRRPISSIHSVLMFCIPYHLFHLFLRSVEKRFSLLSEHICSIFLLFSSKSKNGNILLDIIEVRCSGNDREISLNMPAKNYLDGRFTCTLAIYRMTDWTTHH